jgi:hypothetical protein
MRVKSAHTWQISLARYLENLELCLKNTWHDFSFNAGAGFADAADASIALRFGWDDNLCQLLQILRAKSAIRSMAFMQPVLV